MKSWKQNLIPQHLLSRLMGKLANAKLGCLTHFGIKKFITHYHVNMSEAKISDYRQFQTFNDFFTRELKSDARVMPSDPNAFISPVDGCVSECGQIEKDQLLQAKGAYFNLLDLLGGDKVSAQYFEDGQFLTAYLSPKDYHRFHMPIAGELKKMIYVPGKLFSVNQLSVKNVSGLFARNERVICIFDTEIGKVALIAVGAMIVGSVSMKWHDIVAPQQKRSIQSWDYSDQKIMLNGWRAQSPRFSAGSSEPLKNSHFPYRQKSPAFMPEIFNRGDEVGHFRLGSTVIMLCEKNKMQWDADLCAEKSLRLFDKIGNITA